MSWRKGWDSNPRYGITVYRISSPAHSTTLPPFRLFEIGLPEAPVFASPSWSSFGEAKIIEQPSQHSKPFFAKRRNGAAGTTTGGAQLAEPASSRSTPPM